MGIYGIILTSTNLWGKIMKFAKIVRYIIGAICAGIGIYFAVWSILNPDYAAGYPFMAFVLFVVGVAIIIWTAVDNDLKFRKNDRSPKQQTLEEYMDYNNENLEEQKFNPEEKIFVNGIDVNKLPYKSKTVAILLCLFLGLLGIHRIYLGHTHSGIAMMAITLCLGWTILVPIVLCILCLIDIVSIAKGDLRDSYHRPLI